MDTDRNLLFAVLALQLELIDRDQFIQACTLWTTGKETPLAEILVKQDWLTAEDRADVERLLERKLKKHRGDAHASLMAAAGDSVKRSLAALADKAVQQSLAGGDSGGYQPDLATAAPSSATGERYTLSRLHGKGGIGQVWLARDGSLGRQVALKELRPDRAGDAAARARFLEEAQVTGQLEHPGIVPVHDLGRRKEDDQPFYTMRFI